MTGARRFAVLDPFRRRSFSLYFAGQVVSNTGTWMQNLALSLVIVQATGSAQALSYVTAAQFAPLVLLSVPAGVLADRTRPRTIMLIAAAASTVVVLALAVVVSAESPRSEWIYALVAALGCAHTFERVAAQALIYELVGPGALSRAVSLSTISLAAARSIGPGLAGIVFTAFGPTISMLVNAGSFGAVVVSLLCIRPASLHPRPRIVRDRTAPRRSIARGNRPLLVLLVVNVVVALLALNMMLLITATVTLTFGGDPQALGAAHALNAIGAIIGGLVATAHPAASVRALFPALLFFGGVLSLTAIAPSLALFLACGPLLGAGIGYYQAVLNTAAQTAVEPEDIGRTMSLVTLGNYGMVPFGALLMGWVIDASSGRIAFGVAAAAALLSAGIVAVSLRPRTR